MRKAIVGVLTSVMLLTSGLTALAGPTDSNKDIYNGVSNSISNLGMVNEHKTIIVSKTHDIDKNDITDEVVYVDQSISAYSTAMKVMFMDDLTEGYYKATMGSVNSSNSETVYFVVGDFDVNPEDKISVISEAEPYGIDAGQTWYKKGFVKTVTIEEFGTYKSIKLISEDGTKCIGAIDMTRNYSSDNTEGYKWDKLNLTGDGEVTIALQVYAIPAEHTGFNLYFSTDAVVAQ